MNYRVWLIFASIGIAVIRGFGEDRLWLHASIKGAPIRLFFDTGASDLILFKNTADHLGLTYTAPSELPASGRSAEVLLGVTEPCEIDLAGQKYRGPVAVYGIPEYMTNVADGVLGRGFCKSCIYAIDAGEGRFETLTEIPITAKNWPHLSVLSDSDTLKVKTLEDGQVRTITIDTGFSIGVALCPEKWREWRAAHPRHKVTLEAGFMPGAGLTVREVAWAKTIVVGPIKFSNLLVTEANKVQSASPSFTASLGLPAIKQLKLIIEGTRSVAYSMARNQVTNECKFNRLGAVFIPNNPLKDNDLLAHVAVGSPAEKAGLRDNDILLKIDELDVTQWRTDKRIFPISRFFERPQGTSLRLRVKQGKVERDMSVTLEDFIKPRPRRARTELN